MASISKIIKERLALEAELKAMTESFERRKNELTQQIGKCKEQEQIVSSGLDLDKIEAGKKILYVHGDPYGYSDDVRPDRSNTIAKCAIADIMDGCKHLRSEFFGNKRYEGYYQRCDCNYGFGPSHGSIVDSIGLRNPKMELTEDDVEAAPQQGWRWHILGERGFRGRCYPSRPYQRARPYLRRGRELRDGSCQRHNSCSSATSKLIVMAWYWIVLIVIGYIFMAIVTGVLYGVVLDEETDMCTIAGAFWPVMLPFLILMLPFMLIHAILDWIL